MPIRPSLWRSMATPRLYRGVDWGELASLSMLDTRQFRSTPPCAAPSVARNVRLDYCAERMAPGRSMLGGAQEAWVAQRLATERRPWSLLAQGVFFAPLALDGTGDVVFSDQWDGYAASRTRLLDQLAQPAVRNPLVLSGDVHSFWLNDLHRDHGGSGPSFATEIVTSALAAQSPPVGRFGDVRVNNPHVRFSDMSKTGYVRVEMDQRRLTAEMRAINARERHGQTDILARITREIDGTVSVRG
jgi:alkaline phosphatase D